MISLSALIAESIAFPVNLASFWTNCFATVSKIQDYLAKPEREDSRLFTIPLSTATGDGNATDGLRNRTENGTQAAFAVRFEDVNVTLDLSGSILRGATFSAKPGEITMLHGTVACGKSTIAQTILGETQIRNGLAVCGSRSIAYAGQIPWFLDATIRVNIIGYNEFDQELYSYVVEVCDLQVDFDELPDGDETMVKSDTYRLSRSLKQRIVSRVTKSNRLNRLAKLIDSLLLERCIMMQILLSWTTPSVH